MRVTKDTTQEELETFLKKTFSTTTIASKITQLASFGVEFLMKAEKNHYYFFGFNPEESAILYAFFHKDGSSSPQATELQNALKEKDRELIEKDRELIEKDRKLIEKDRELIEKTRQMEWESLFNGTATKIADRIIDVAKPLNLDSLKLDLRVDLQSVPIPANKNIASQESWHQQELFKWLRSTVHWNDLSILDTHSTGLQGENDAKIDISVVYGNTGAYPNLVVPIEIKSDLRDTTMRKTGIAQVAGRLKRILAVQPNRRVVFGVLLSCYHCLFIRMDRSYQFSLSDILPLCQTKGGKPDIGAQYLIGLLSADVTSVLGFVPSVVASLRSLIKFTHLNQMHRVETVSAIRNGGGERSGIFIIKTDKSGEFIMKAGTWEDVQIDNEISVLQDLCQIEHVSLPQLIYSFRSDTIMEPFTQFAILSPVGQHNLMGRFGSDFQPKEEEILHWMKQINDLLCKVHSHSIVHGDVGASNIVISGDNAVLIDWGLAVRIGQEISGYSVLFGSLRVLISQYYEKPYLATPADDFEGLFSTLLYLFFRGKLPWIHHIPREDRIGRRLFHLTFPTHFEQLLDKLPPQSVSPQTIQLLKSMRDKLFPVGWELRAPNIDSLF